MLTLLQNAIGPTALRLVLAVALFPIYAPVLIVMGVIIVFWVVIAGLLDRRTAPKNPRMRGYRSAYN